MSPSISYIWARVAHSPIIFVENTWNRDFCIILFLKTILACKSCWRHYFHYLRVILYHLLCNINKQTSELHLIPFFNLLPFNKVLWVASFFCLCTVLWIRFQIGSIQVKIGKKRGTRCYRLKTKSNYSETRLTENFFRCYYCLKVFKNYVFCS